MWWLELEQPLKLCGNLGTEVLNTEAKVQESWSAWWDRTSLGFWPCMSMRERNQVFFCWRTVIWDSNRKIILMDTGSHHKDLVPCSWLQKSTCYPIFSHLLHRTTWPSWCMEKRCRKRGSHRNKWTQQQLGFTPGLCSCTRFPPTSPGEPRGDTGWGLRRWTGVRLAFLLGGKMWIGSMSCLFEGDFILGRHNIIISRGKNPCHFP